MTFQTIVGKIQSSIFTPMVALIISWAAVTFLWALIKYIKSEDPNAKGEAVKTISWGILILAVMLSVWGLVNLLTNTFSSWGSNSSQNINIPQMQAN